MIPRCPGWTRDEMDGRVTLTHRDGATSGVIRYHERVRPLRGFDDLLAETVAGVPSLTDVSISPPELAVTAEGERAATAMVEARLDGVPVALALGAVFGDDFYARVAGRATCPDAFAELNQTVRALVHHDVLGLGVRRRSLQHRGPAGWTARPRGLATDWIEPGAGAVIRVFPAEPTTGPTDPLGVLAAATASEGRALDDIDGPYDLATTTGLAGTTWRVTSGDVRCDLAVLSDARYEYAVVLESRSEEVQERHRAALHEVLSTIWPLTAAGRVAAAAADDAFAHWTH